MVALGVVSHSVGQVEGSDMDGQNGAKQGRCRAAMTRKISGAKSTRFPDAEPRTTMASWVELVFCQLMTKEALESRSARLLDVEPRSTFGLWLSLARKFLAPSGAP